MIPEQLAEIRADIENTPVSGATPEQVYACVKGGLLLLDAYKVARQWVHDLQAGMYITCVYCGHRYGPDDEVPATMADVLKEHIAQCPEHPMSALKRELNVVLERERELAEALTDLRISILGMECYCGRGLSDWHASNTTCPAFRRYSGLFKAETVLRKHEEARRGDA